MKRMLAMLLVMMLLFTGCVSEKKQEPEAAPDVSVSEQETADIDSGEAED